MRLPSSLIRRFVHDERGVFAVIFGLMAIVLVAVGGAVVDYVSLEQARNRAQIALDAAALALQPQIYNATATPTWIRDRARALVNDQIGNDSRITVTINTPVIDRENGSLRLSGSFDMPTYFVQLVGVRQVGAAFASEVVRGAVDVEVSVALDVTGSMRGQPLIDLKAAVRELVDAVVQDVQTPNYTKMALVPYSQAVNAGSYATALRGPVRGPRDITSISWMFNTTIKSINGISRASPATVTANGHGFNNGDWVYVWGVFGMSQINNRAYQVTNRTADTFQLAGVNSSNYGWHIFGGNVRRCANANCNVVVRSDNHGYAAGQYLHITDSAISDLNDQTLLVASTTTHTLTLSEFPTPSGTGTHTSSTGKLHCTWQTTAQGCTYYRFLNTSGGYSTHALTTCVTERTPNGATDRPPTTTLMGRNYPESGNGCTSHPIVPLTANKTTLHNTINALVDNGSTSGSLGVLWSWYMLAPNLGYVWPAESRPAPYRDNNLLKAAIIMTDGEFNTVHCEGVVARNTGNGSGGSKIDCNAPNGDPYDQARAYCNAMKAPNTGIIVYTVGFGISAGTPAADFMSSCASTPENAFLAQNGAALTAAFRQIAQNISALRVAR